MAFWWTPFLNTRIKQISITKILEALTKLSLEGRKIILFWIPSHIGISKNEKVDLAVKEATFEQTLPTNNILCFKDLLKLHWNNFAPPHIKNTSDYPLQQDQYLLDLSRTHQVAISRLRIGHTKITHSHSYSKKTAKPTCQQCNCTLTLQHLTPTAKNTPSLASNSK